MYASTAASEPLNMNSADSEAEKAVAPVVDLRSDTVTRPNAKMRRAMAEAEVGDDVYGEDPTVNRLQQRAAEIFGREAALFVPTGSMGNLIAVKVWTQPGNEVICDQRGHINQYEMASMSAISGCLSKTAVTPDGILSWQLIEPLISPKIYYRAQTELISLENTHNMAGGTVYPTRVAEDICDKAHAAGLKVHLDGARVFNASAALGEPVDRITSKFDSVMFCLSKGLGAPVGSMLVGSREFIEKARIVRKLVGGGMRQAGVLAAAGLVALEDSPSRLHEDHANAKFLAEGLSRLPGIALDPQKVQTNIVIFDVRATGKTSSEIAVRLATQRVLCGPSDKFSIRMVTHCDVDRNGIARALDVFASVLKN